MGAKDFNGSRLKSARVYRGLSVADLAERLGLQRQTIALYEAQKIDTPNFEHVRKMADILNFPIDFFLQEDQTSVQFGSTYFRSLLTTNRKYRSEQIERVKYLGEIYRFLNEYIDFFPLNLPTKYIEDPEEAATELRTFWSLGDKPIKDIVRLVEENGLFVTEFSSESDSVDAFSQQLMIDGETRYLISYSNNKSSAARVHFDIAHELGHILLHSWAEDVEEMTKEEFREVEQQAHNFAGALLLPKEVFLSDLGSYGNKLDYYYELKKKWKVSIAAMIRRAYNLGSITQLSYQQLMRTMQKRGIRKSEPLDDELETSAPSIFCSAIDVLLEEKVFTPQEFVNSLAEEGGVSLKSSEIENLLGLPSGQLSFVESTQNIRHQLRLLKSN